MKNKLTIVDGDSLTFFSSKETIEDSISNLKQRIDTIIDRTKATHYLLCLTGSNCFRYDLCDYYKKSRKDNAKKYPQKLKYLKTLKSLLIEEYNAVLIQELESDDICSYYAYNLPEYETIIASPDKDVLNQLEGPKYNYSKDQLFNVNREQADRFLAYQLICGDSVDNIYGLKEKTKYMKETYGLDNRSGVGEATANKILDIIESKNQNYAAEILKCYISKYEDEPAGIPVGNKSSTVKLFRVGKTKEDLGFEDYILNYNLLKLNTSIGRYNKILQNYDISEHINEVKTINLINEEF